MRENHPDPDPVRLSFFFFFVSYIYVIHSFIYLFSFLFFVLGLKKAEVEEGQTNVTDWGIDNFLLLGAHVMRPPVSQCPA